MADRFAERPSFDEYVVARGADLLRTAWLLVGDDRRAEDLVREALAHSWPQWRHLSEVGAGSYDAELRRSLMTTYLRRPLRWRSDEDAKPHVPQGQASVPPTRRDVLGALSALSRRERAMLVLWTFDGLSDAQIAEALDDGVTAVHRHRLHAVATVCAQLTLDEEGLRSVLAGLPPQDPSVDGLVHPPRPYAGRARGARGWALAVAGLAVVGVVAGLATRGGGEVVDPSPTTPEPAALACRSSFGPPSPLVAPTGPLSRDVAAVLVCAQTDEGSVWAGSLPPDAPVTAPLAVDALALQPRTDGTGCANLPQGPAFRMVLRRNDGSIRTYANEGLACNGWPALASYYVALAEQSADPGSGSGATGDGFLGCPSILGKALSPPGVEPPRLARGTVLRTATACLHPRPVLRAIPRYRAIRANVMGTPQLAQLNGDLAKTGSGTAAGSTCTAGASLFVVRAMTQEGRLVELSSNCADQFNVDWAARDTWRVSAQTRDMLRALLVVAD